MNPVEQFHIVQHGTQAEPFHAHAVCRLEDITFDCGVTLHNVNLAYETWGTLNSTRDNVVVICHALTGNAHVSGNDGWWNGVVGPKQVIDTEKYFVIAVNALGGCNGSSGPTTLASDGKPYGLYFPLVTVRDMVRSQIMLLDILDIPRVELVIGASLGGMQAWEWAILGQSRVGHTVVIAADAAFSSLAIGYNAAMRQAIISDPDWCEGDYQARGVIPSRGMGVARAIGMLTYRSSPLFEERFGRALSEGEHGEWSRQTGNRLRAFTQPFFAIESYLEHHGKKLSSRFDANSYLYLTRAMDHHDIGAGRGGQSRALQTIKGRLTVIGIDTDYLYPVAELTRTVERARSAGVTVNYVEMSSIHGHDAFLVDQPYISTLLQEVLFMKQI